MGLHSYFALDLEFRAEDLLGFLVGGISGGRQTWACRPRAFSILMGLKAVGRFLEAPETGRFNVKTSMNGM